MSGTVTPAIEQLRGIGHDVKLRFLPALHEHRRNSVQPVQARLDLIGRHLPQLGLRDVVGGQAVTNDRKAGERHAMRFTIFAVGGSSCLHARQRRIHVLQRLEHVHVPAEEQIDLRRARGW